MATIHTSENELASDRHAVLAKVLQGIEVVIEHDHRPVAVLRPPAYSGRPISECIASAATSGSKATLDEGLAEVVEQGIRSRQDGWDPPSWD